MRSDVAVASPARFDSLLDSEAVRHHQRLSAAVAAGGEQVRARGRRTGQGPWRGWQSGARAGSVSASMPEYTQTRVRMRRPQARRTRAVVG